MLRESCPGLGLDNSCGTGLGAASPSPSSSFPTLVPRLEGTFSQARPGAWAVSSCQQTPSFFASRPRKHLLENLRGKFNERDEDALLRRDPVLGTQALGWRGSEIQDRVGKLPNTWLGEDQDRPRWPHDQATLLQWTGIIRNYKLSLPSGQPQSQIHQWEPPFPSPMVAFPLLVGGEWEPAARTCPLPPVQDAPQAPGRIKVFLPLSKVRDGWDKFSAHGPKNLNCEAIVSSTPRFSHLPHRLS